MAKHGFSTKAYVFDDTVTVDRRRFYNKETGKEEKREYKLPENLWQNEKWPAVH